MRPITICILRWYSAIDCKKGKNEASEMRRANMRQRLLIGRRQKTRGKVITKIRASLTCTPHLPSVGICNVLTTVNAKPTVRY